MITVQMTAVTADGAIKAAPGALCSVVLTGGSDAATLVLYDNASAASGTVLLTLKAAAATSIVFTPAQAAAVGKGIYADITGTAAAAYVAFW